MEEAAAPTPIAPLTLGGTAAAVIKQRFGKHGCKPRQELMRRASEGGCSRRRGIGEHEENLTGGAEVVEVQIGRLQHR